MRQSRSSSSVQRGADHGDAHDDRDRRQRDPDASAGRTAAHRVVRPPSVRMRTSAPSPTASVSAGVGELDAEHGLAQQDADRQVEQQRGQAQAHRDPHGEHAEQHHRGRDAEQHLQARHAHLRLSITLTAAAGQGFVPGRPAPHGEHTAPSRTMDGDDARAAGCPPDRAPLRLRLALFAAVTLLAASNVVSNRLWPQGYLAWNLAHDGRAAAGGPGGGLTRADLGLRRRAAAPGAGARGARPRRQSGWLYAAAVALPRPGRRSSTRAAPCRWRPCCSSRSSGSRSAPSCWRSWRSAGCCPPWSAAASVGVVAGDAGVVGAVRALARAAGDGVGERGVGRPGHGGRGDRDGAVHDGGGRGVPRRGSGGAGTSSPRCCCTRPRTPSAR